MCFRSLFCGFPGHSNDALANLDEKEEEGSYKNLVFIFMVASPAFSGLKLSHDEKKLRTNRFASYAEATLFKEEYKNLYSGRTRVRTWAQLLYIFQTNILYVFQYSC